MIPRIMLAISVLCLAAHSATAVPLQEVEQSLKQRYEGKILILRHPLQGSSLAYASDGKVLKGGSEGPWTVYGRIKVAELQLQADKLLLKGMRVGYKPDVQGKLAPFPTKKHITVQISLASAPQKMAEVDAVLGHIFAVTRKDVVDSAPDFWRQYLERNFPASGSDIATAPDAHAAPPVVETKTVESKEAETKVGEAKSVEAKVEDLKVMKTTTTIPPKAVYTPAPSLPDSVSRGQHFEGVVVLDIFVDQTGKVGRVHIVRPLGEGIDEEAVNAVRKWRFKPAQREGRAVGVEMNIECAFNMAR